MDNGFIREIGAEDSVLWNKTVKKIDEYDVFYLNEYIQAFRLEDKTNGEPVLVVYENGEDVAVNVIFRRDIAKSEYFIGKLDENRYYDLISPYGYGGFIGKVTDYARLNEVYGQYCAEKGYISEFVRFELFGNYYKHYPGIVESRTHNVVRDLSMPLEEIWMDFKQKVRKNVKRAVSKGLEVIVDEQGDYLDDFLQVYYGTMERTQAKKDFFFARDFFEELNQMKGHFSYFHVKYGDKIISTELVLCGAENCYSYLGGTNSEYFELRPNDFLKYEIIKWAKNKGFKYFILGGGYGSDDGIFQYKTCLAPNGVVDFYIGKRIFEKEVYEMLVRMREEDAGFDTDTEFFPKYRG